MNLKPDKATREKCDAFAQSLMQFIAARSTELELAPGDVAGVLFGIGIGAALETKQSVDDICKFVRTLARLNAERAK